MICGTHIPKRQMTLKSVKIVIKYLSSSFPAPAMTTAPLKPTFQNILLKSVLSTPMRKFNLNLKMNQIATVQSGVRSKKKDIAMLMTARTGKAKIRIQKSTRKGLLLEKLCRSPWATRARPVAFPPAANARPAQSKIASEPQRGSHAASIPA